jgi:hypothetical protein
MLRVKQSVVPLLIVPIVAAVAGYYLGATNLDRQRWGEARAGQVEFPGKEAPKLASETRANSAVQTQHNHFHAKGQPPSKFTIEVLKKVRAAALCRQGGVRGAEARFHRRTEI